jgi:hypothetical protein
MNNIPAAKIKMMKASIRCLVFGVLGLIPVIGLPFALAALWISGRVRVREKLYWNAARPYRIWGVACAALGAVLWIGILTIIFGRSLMVSQGLG